MANSHFDPLDVDLDLASATDAMGGWDVANRHGNGSESKDLNKVLPKLARRISKNSPQKSAGVSFNSEPTQETPMGSPTPTPPSHSKRRNTRKSVRGSIIFKMDAELSPQVEEMRAKDIEPDEDSAALRALQKAAAAASAGAEGANAAAEEDDPTQYVYPEKRKVEGREIQQGHAQYALTYGMMLGIRVTTGRQILPAFSRASSTSSSSQQEHELTPADYTQTVTLDFHPQGNNAPPYPTPPHKLPFTFQFKDYMTNVFRAVRALNNIDEAEYMMSLAGDFNYIEFIANSKSGQFFFYSHDGKYMIKTQTKDECTLLKSIFPGYIQHLTQYPDSMLVKFYGLHRVYMPSLKRRVYFCVMSSVFDTPLPIHVKYDLKGSSVGRRTDADQCMQGAVQKDLNLQESGRQLVLGSYADLFYSTLQADTTFLKNLNIMDYSLLLGVYEGEKEKGIPGGLSGSNKAARRRSSCGVVLSTRFASPPVSAPRLAPSPTTSSVSVFTSYWGGLPSPPEVNEVYFMGIIDILQIYTPAKKMETFVKSFSHATPTLSCVPPPLYADRLLRFVVAATDYPSIMAMRRKLAREQSGVDKGGKKETSARSSTNASPEKSKGERRSSNSFGKDARKEGGKKTNVDPDAYDLL